MMKQKIATLFRSASLSCSRNVYKQFFVLDNLFNGQPPDIIYIIVRVRTTIDVFPMLIRVRI